MNRSAPTLGIVLLALAACSRADAPAPNMAEAAAAAEAIPPTPDPAVHTARRCGWLHNPTPGNWWLVDGDGEWILATQGGDQAPGMDDLPDMSEAGWEKINGNYGYGCACMTLTVEAATRKVVRIASPKVQPLKQCRADRALPRP